jgi:hypothetical protein
MRHHIVSADEMTRSQISRELEVTKTDAPDARNLWSPLSTSKVSDQGLSLKNIGKPATSCGWM